MTMISVHSSGQPRMKMMIWLTIRNVSGERSRPTTKSLITASPPSAAKTAEKVKEPTNSQPTMAEVLAVRNTDSLSFSKVRER